MSFTEARQEMQKGNVYGIFYIPSGFAVDATSGKQPRLSFYTNATYFDRRFLAVSGYEKTVSSTNEGVGLLAGQTGIIIFCKHYLQVFPNSEKEEILEGFLETYFDKLTSEIGLFTYCGGLTRRFGGFEIPEPRAVVGDRLFRCGEKLSGIAANIRDKQYSKRELRLPAWRTGHRQILLRRRRVCKPGIGGIGANR